MANMRIPEPVRPGVFKLLELTQEQAQELLVALEQVEPTLSHRRYISRIESLVSGVSKTDLSEIVQTLISFYRYRYANELDLTATIKDVLTSPDLKLSEEQRVPLQELLPDLLDDIESLVITSKAVDLLFAQERLLMKARILTDARPLFKEESLDMPLAAMVTHTLQIVYMESGADKKQEIFFAIDADDIASLRRSLDRAEAKAKSVNKMIQKADVKTLEVTDE
jgi:hypothetical protein